MVIKFGGRNKGGICEWLAMIKQTGTVEDYVQDFEVLVRQTKAVSNEQLLGYFLVGLQRELRCQIRPHDPQELMMAMRIARDVEDAQRGTREIG